MFDSQMKVASQLCLLTLTLSVAATATSTATAQDWPHWRGPNFDGSAKAENLPVEFHRRKNVRWKTELPGPGASTPIVIGERIFLTSVDSKRDRLVALCIDRESGKIVWQRDAGSGYGAERGARIGGKRSNYASPSATSDGERVVFFFGNGDLCCYDLAGKEQWRRNIQKEYGDFAFQWTFSSSPTLFAGKVFLPVMQRDQPVGRGGGRGRGRGRRGGPADAGKRKPNESFLLAMEPETGKTIYKHLRPSPAQMESLESYATVIPRVVGDRTELLIVGGDVITGHDPNSGEEIWRWGNWNFGNRQRAWRLVPSVVFGSGVALVCAPKRAPVYAIKLGGKGELSDEDALVWKSEGRPNPVSSDVPTPAYSSGHFYVLGDGQYSISKVKAEDGKVLWTTRLARDYLWRASPTVADGKVYCMNHNGEVAVIDAASGKTLHHAFMGDEEDDRTRSSVVVAHGKLFIRTNSTLFCIGK